MKKEQFIKNLRYSLRKLKKDEREKYLAYYEEIISDMIENGVSEEEAVAHQGETKKSLGYIPGGSTNDFAHSLKIPKNLVAAAGVITLNRQYLCDIGGFNEDYFVYIAAFGLFTDVSYQTSQQLKNILGHVAYVLEGAKRIFNIKAYKMSIEIEGEMVTEEFIYGMVTNSESVGGFRNMTGKNVKLKWEHVMDLTGEHIRKHVLILSVRILHFD